PFISNAGVAFDALISEKFSGSRRRGFLTYSWLVMKHLWRYREKSWKIKIGGEEFEERAFIVNIANGRQFGYHFKIAPGASWTDGLLDIIVVRKFPKLYSIFFTLRLLNGTILKSPYVRHYQAKEITITHPELTRLQVDGDPHYCEA